MEKLTEMVMLYKIESFGANGQLLKLKGQKSAQPSKLKGGGSLLFGEIYIFDASILKVI